MCKQANKRGVVGPTLEQICTIDCIRLSNDPSGFPRGVWGLHGSSCAQDGERGHHLRTRHTIRTHHSQIPLTAIMSKINASSTSLDQITNWLGDSVDFNLFAFLQLLSEEQVEFLCDLWVVEMGDFPFESRVAILKWVSDKMLDEYYANGEPSVALGMGLEWFEEWMLHRIAVCSERRARRRRASIELKCFDVSVDERPYAEVAGHFVQYIVSDTAPGSPATFRYDDPTYVLLQCASRKLKRFQRWQKREQKWREWCETRSWLDYVGPVRKPKAVTVIAAVVERIVDPVRVAVRRIFKKVHEYARFGQLLQRREQVKLQAGERKYKKASVKREAREEIQRACAEQKKEQARKSVPKTEREAKIAQARSMKAVRNQDGLGEVQLQAGACYDKDEFDFQKYLPYVTGAAATAASVAVGVAAYKFANLVGKINRRTSQVDTLFDTLNGYAQQLSRILGEALWATPLVLTVFFFFRRPSLSNVVKSLLVTALAAIVGKPLWDIVSNYFVVSEVTLQSGVGNVLVDAAPKLLASCFAFSVLRGKMTNSVVGEFTRRISTLNRSSEGWESFLTWILGCLETCVNFGREFFGLDRIKLIEDTHVSLWKWSSRVNDIVCKAETDCDLSPELVDQLVELVAEGHALKDVYKATPMNATVSDHLSRAISALRPFQGSINARNNFRVEPVGVMINGAPGIGKTLTSIYFCAAVLLESGLLPPGTKPNDVFKHIWQKGNSEFWNGYAQQLVMMVDDAFQQRADKTDKENDFMTIIRAIGPWAFPLNFADLASKGKIYFNSAMVFGTTNLAGIASEAMAVLNEPGAVIRRLKYSYTMSVVEEFALADGKLDINKYFAELRKCQASGGEPLDKFPWHIWRVRKHDFGLGCDIGDHMPFRDVVVDVARELRVRAANHADATQMISDFVQGYGGPQLQGLGKYLAPGYLFSRKEKFSASFSLLWERTKEEMYSMHEAAKKVKLFGFGVSGAAAAGVFLFGAISLLKPVLMSIWDFLKGLFGFTSSPEPVAMSTLHSNHPLTKPVRTSKKIERPVAIQSVNTDIFNNVYANTYKLLIPDDGNGCVDVFGQVTFIDGDLAVMPRHFTSLLLDRLESGALRPTTVMQLRSAVNQQNRVEFTVGDFVTFRRMSKAGTDVEFVVFPNIRAHRRITNCIIKESDINAIKNRPVRLDVCKVGSRGKFSEINTREILSSTTCGLKLDAWGDGHQLGRIFKYEAITETGDCGAPLCSTQTDLLLGRAFCGFHVAAEVGLKTGYSVILTQEMVEEARRELELITDDFHADMERRGVKLQASHALPFGEWGSFMPIWRVEKGVSISPKTSYYRTFLYGRMGDYEDSPAPLAPVWRNGVLVYPMDNAVLPYSTPLKHYNQEWLEQAMHVAMTPLTKLTYNSDRSIYTFEESVLGIPNRKFRSIPRRTSPGFPYVYSCRDGKKSFFGSAEVMDLTRPEAIELKERCEFIVQEAKKGVRLSHVFMDFLKDELRSPAKVEAVATRLISAAPLDYVVVFRQYFGAFSSEVMHFNLLTGMAPGINVYADSGKLAEKLSSKGSKCFDGDFKGFDSSEQPVIHMLILDYINSWYDDGEENALVRKVLWMELVHSRHIGGRGFDQSYIYQWTKSLPSGHPFTTIVNSMYSLFLMVAAYISNTGDVSGFWDNVSSVVYGDDNVSNVSDYVAEDFNQVTVSKALAEEFGVVYTSGSKDGTLVPYKTLEDMTFLKRSLRLEDGYWKSPLELKSFLYTHYWNCNKFLEEDILRDVLENALCELSLHDDEKWLEYSPLLIECLRLLKQEPKLVPKRANYLKAVKSRLDSWF